VISSQLARVHDRIWAAGLQDDVRIISHTVDPQNDTPERMKEYGERLGADGEVWKFLTGPEEDLYPLLQEGYLLTALASDTAAGGFFHSDQVILVDAQGHLRGTYDGTRTSDVDQMFEDLMQVLAKQKASTANQVQP
jgi:protein SCO1/2